jgi:predicted DNA-binding transcriptional regulator AlpA
VAAKSKQVPGELLKPAEAGERLKVSEWTLANWRRCGFGPPYVRLKGNDLRFPEDGLRKWIEERTVNSLAEERGQGKEFPGSEAGGFRGRADRKGVRPPNPASSRL